MLHLAFLTLTLMTSQTLKMEVSRTVDEFLSQLGLTPTHYDVVISDQVPEGAAVLYVVNSAGEDTALFLFERKLLLELSRRERRVLIGHEVAHLAPDCQGLWARIYREICADWVSLKLVPVKDVKTMMIKSILKYDYYPAQEEFMYRLAMLQGHSESREEEKPAPPSSAKLQSEEDWRDCA